MTETWIARITDEWLPLPAELLLRLGWQDGDLLEAERVGDALVLTRFAEPLRGRDTGSAPTPEN